MGLATIIGLVGTGPMMGGVQIDVSVNETHRSTSEVTDHAIELGSDVSDHIRRMPDEVTLEGVVSNSPTTIADRIALDLSGDDAQKRYQELIDLVESADTFELITGLRTYLDMVITSFDVTRDQTTGEIVRFRADMKQLRFATAEEVAVIASVTDNPKAANTTDTGPKKPTPTPDGAANGMRSTASKVFTKPNVESFVGILGG